MSYGYGIFGMINYCNMGCVWIFFGVFLRKFVYGCFFVCFNCVSYFICVGFVG